MLFFVPVFVHNILRITFVNQYVFITLSLPIIFLLIDSFRIVGQEKHGVILYTFDAVSLKGKKRGKVRRGKERCYLCF